MNGVPSLVAAYRSLLSWYPRRWRTANAEAMLGALLDQAEAEGRTAPTPADRAAIIRGGLVERMGIGITPSRRTLALGGAALVLATIVPLVARIVFAFPQPIASAWLYQSWQPGPEAVSGIVLVLGAAVLAFGIRREPGLPGRSVVGRVALIVWALVSAAQSIPTPLATLDTDPTLLMVLSILPVTEAVVTLIALGVAAFTVVRSGVVVGLARWGFVALALASVTMPLVVRFSPPALSAVAFWAYPAVLLLQAAVGIVFVLGGLTAVRRTGSPARAV